MANILTHTLSAPDPAREYYLNGRGYKSGHFGPYPAPVRMRVRAYGVHKGGGGDASASLLLRYNGDPAGQASDRNFDRANLQVVYNMILDPNMTAAFELESNNHVATELYAGFEVWLSLA